MLVQMDQPPTVSTQSPTLPVTTSNISPTAVPNITPTTSAVTLPTVSTSSMMSPSNVTPNTLVDISRLPTEIPSSPTIADMPKSSLNTIQIPEISLGKHSPVRIIEEDITVSPFYFQLPKFFDMDGILGKIKRMKNSTEVIKLQ